MYQVVQRMVLKAMYADKVANNMFLGIDLKKTKAGNFGLILGQGGDIAGWILALLLRDNVLTKPTCTKETVIFKKNTAAHGAQSAQAEQSAKMMKYMQVLHGHHDVQYFTWFKLISTLLDNR